MITEAIILAGGKGSRLQPVVSEIPKPLAVVNKIPFLSYLFRLLQKQGIQHIYLSIGHLGEKINDFYGNQFESLHLTYILEDSPLGTGGAIKKTLNYTKSNEVLILNGDSYLDLNMLHFYQFHLTQKAAISLALSYQKNASRYGTVITKNDRVTSFQEKKEGTSGWINAGIYIVNKQKINFEGLSKSFSFEKEILEKKTNELSLSGYQQEGYFIDIGIPSDYEKAQQDFKLIEFREKNHDFSNWTLFLDRDGVINKKIDKGYITQVSEFEFIEGTVEAISILSKLFKKILIVTNQQGIGKKIMTLTDVNEIHEYMVKEIEKKGGRIDKIYIAPDLAHKKNTLRKPQPGMADLAKKDFPGIDFEHSIMVGDSITDMQFGKRKKMITVGINLKTHKFIDYNIFSLSEFAQIISKS